MKNERIKADIEKARSLPMVAVLPAPGQDPLRKELEDLRAWKEGALASARRWDNVVAAAQQSTRFKFGDDIPEKIAAIISELSDDTVHADLRVLVTEHPEVTARGMESHGKVTTTFTGCIQCLVYSLTQLLVKEPKLVFAVQAALENAKQLSTFSFIKNENEG